MSCSVIEKPVIEIIRPQHDINLSREVGREVNVVPTGAPGPPGPVGSINTVFGEIPQGAINGSNATFSTVFSFVPESVEIYVNGLRQRRLDDFNTTGANTLNLFVSPTPGDLIQVNYLRSN